MKYNFFWKSKSQGLQLDIQQSMLFLLIILIFSISYFTRLLFFLRFSNVTHPTSTVYINMREIPDHRWKFWLLHNLSYTDWTKSREEFNFPVYLCSVNHI